MALLSLNEAEQAKAAADPAAAVVQAEEEEPEPLSEADAKANPIKASAQALKIAASRWDRKNNPLVSRSSDLAEKMKSLSNGLNSRAPKEMIESARGIVTVCRHIWGFAAVLPAPLTYRGGSLFAR